MGCAETTGDAERRGAATDRPHGRLPHRAIVALSFAPRLDAAARAELARRAGRALELLCDAAPRALHAETDLLVLEAGEPAPGCVAEDGAFAHSVGIGGTNWRRARACEGPALLADVRATGAAALADYTPPFAALFRAGPTAPLEAATDTCGLMHLFVTAGTGFAACSSSCLALGALRDDGLDLESLAAYAYLSLYPGARTPVSGVRRLQARERCTLSAGTLRVAVWADRPPRQPAFTSFAQAVDAGADALRAALETFAAAHPRLGLSLSGGLDSRLALAALPRGRRAALQVLCIETPGQENAAIVRRLAALVGFAPTFVAVDAFPRQRALAAASTAARQRGYCANPFATAILEWVESRLPNTPRMNGQNGEFLRGHYYGRGAPTDGAVTRERVAPLVRSGELRGGKPASPQVLAAAYRAPVEASLHEETYAWLAATGLPWHDALDELYLCQRMAGWIGTELSRTSMWRIDLSPFFDPRVLAFARRAAPRDKLRLRLAAAVLEALDPALAALPLDGRPAPATLWRADPAAATAGSPTPPRSAGANEPVGAAAVRRSLLHDAERAGLSLRRAAALPLFREHALDGPLRVDSTLDLATLGFVLDVEWMLAFLERARAGQPR
ncbi:hypothetical protein KF840_04075 [bacterium]|nr:hypothetical protein [bacterium]